MSRRARKKKLDLTFRPLTEALWPDLETLFGPRGACGGCWCMFWRLSRSQFEEQKGDGNRHALHAIVDRGEKPGILAYHEKRAVGWCALAPRASYTLLARSRILKPLDEEPVWSITCFFVAKDYRGQGVTVQLLEAARDDALRRGAKIVEGYPIDPRAGRIADVFAYTGLMSAFKKAGFVECARRSETRPIMRYYVEQ